MPTLRAFAPTTPPMTDDNLLPFSFPAVSRRKVAAAFDGGVILLSMAEQRLGLADRLARCFPDHRDPTRIRRKPPAKAAGLAV